MAWDSLVRECLPKHDTDTCLYIVYNRCMFVLKVSGGSNNLMEKADTPPYNVACHVKKSIYLQYLERLAEEEQYRRLESIDALKVSL